MDSGWVGAIASIASALVVTLTALAVFRQVQHNRNANEIVVYFRLIDQMDAPEMLQARRAVALIAEKVRTDSEYRERLKDATFQPDEFRGVGHLLRSLEHLSVLVTKGGIAQSLILAEYADTFVAMWDQLYPAIVQRRVAFGPYTGRAFEHLAMLSRRYIDSGEMDREYAALERDPRVAGPAAGSTT